MLNHSLFLRILIAGLGARIEVPSKTRPIAGSPDQERGFLKKAVVRYQSQGARFNVSRAVQRVHQETVRALIERDSHGVRCKIATAQIFLDGCGVKYGLAWLGVFSAARAHNIDANAAGKTNINGAGGLILS